MIATRRLTFLAVCAAAGTLSLAACSSGASSAGGSGAPSNATTGVPASSTPNAAVAAAQKDLAQYVPVKPVINLPPLKAKPPTGETIDYVGCPLAVCVQVQQAVEEAVNAIGWKVQVFNGGLTPASYSSAWDAVVQTPNDGVIGIATFPNATIQSQLAQLASKHIPFAATATVDPLRGAMIAEFQSTSTKVVDGKVAADWVVADSNATAHVAYFWDPTFSQNAPQKNAFVAEMSSLCPTCSVDVQQTNFVTGIGTTDPAQIVSYLQRNQKVNYIVLDVGQGAAGVPQAMAAAGLSKVKIVSESAGPTNFKDIQQGSEAMGVTGETAESGWRMVDVIIRHMEGMGISQCCTSPVGTIHTITRADLPTDISQPYTTPGYQSAFEKAWLVGS